MTRQHSILVTGATGFIGQRLVARLTEHEGWDVLAAVRHHAKAHWFARSFVTGELSGNTQWQPALTGVSTVVHLGARVHVLKAERADPLAEYRRINTHGTLNLAQQAAAAGVKRFVFLSTIKVNGSFSSPGRPFTADDTPTPADPYSQSKAEAEQGLREIANQTGMELVIIRPPLVYGPGVKANFATMMRWLNRGLPLPLGKTENRRSLVAVDNLVDLIATCTTHPAAANEVFLAADAETVSTTELLVRTSKALGRSPRLLPVPPSIMKVAANVLGKHCLYERLFESLELDTTKTHERLQWTPPLTLTEALERTAEAFQME
ncbi:UDP-glucose 4-epimerase family protein [Vreelandella utahensis]|uniref:UDP-glucose 4-epimerase family protein n=1 Tax=Vreelandella halophila TaxID=86177 RepID=UPI00098787E3|nr:SDR family oxidoreductase [Halomonas utahensis]